MLEPRQMNEDGLDVREANHRVMNMMSDQERPSAERLPFPRRLNFLGQESLTWASSALRFAIGTHFTSWH
jgi:hypothetical protein